MSHTITEPTQEWIMLCYDVDALILSKNFSDLVFLGYSFVIWCRKDSRWEENKETWDFWSRWSNDHESKSKVISYWLQVLPNPSAGSFFADVWRSGQWRSGQRHSGHWPERKTFRPVPGDFQASKKKICWMCCMKLKLTELKRLQSGPTGKGWGIPEKNNSCPVPCWNFKFWPADSES
jgi:hypothetical protein